MCEFVVQIRVALCTDVGLPRRRALYTINRFLQQTHKAPERRMAVTIKTPEEQAKMRVAGRLAADVLDMIGEHVRPGITTEELDQRCHDYIVDRAAGHPGAAQLPRLPQVHLHIREPRRLSRHPGCAQAEERRHDQHRRHRDQGRLSRRHQPHVLRRQAVGGGASGWRASPTRACAAASRRCVPGRAWGISAT